MNARAPRSRPRGAQGPRGRPRSSSSPAASPRPRRTSPTAARASPSRPGSRSRRRPRGSAAGGARWADRHGADESSTRQLLMPANFASRAEVIPHMTTTKRIVAAAIALLTLLPVAGAQASQPPIAPLKPLEVKWILPPRTSPFYASEKALADGRRLRDRRARRPQLPRSASLTLPHARRRRGLRRRARGEVAAEARRLGRREQPLLEERRRGSGARSSRPAR